MDFCRGHGPSSSRTGSWARSPLAERVSHIFTYYEQSLLNNSHEAANRLREAIPPDSRLALRLRRLMNAVVQANSLFHLKIFHEVHITDEASMLIGNRRLMASDRKTAYLNDLVAIRRIQEEMVYEFFHSRQMKPEA